MSVRLIAPPGTGERWGMDFDVGSVWEIVGEPPAILEPPHVENIIVRSCRRLAPMSKPSQFIERHMPPWIGSPDRLYEGLIRARASGALYVAESTGIPSFSTTFWIPDKPLKRVANGKRIRYEYPDDEIDKSLVFVGFQEPVTEIPAGTLVRVSLAHWWNPPDHPHEEPRCFVQLSGWFDLPASATPSTSAIPIQKKIDTPLPPKMEEAKRVLSRVFGYQEFRPLQHDIISSVLKGRDTLGIMPTGAGKSICFQLPSLLTNGLTVVVSPLISLMQDQIDQLRVQGIAAVALNSSISNSEYADGARRLREGSARLLYVSPETLIRPEIGVLLDECGVSLLTVDEAHCISEWGHDFRPEYRQISAVRNRYLKAVCLAITATATERVRRDIRTVLGISEENTYTAPFDRPNLHLEVSRRYDGTRQVFDYLAERKSDSGIIYCSTREQVDTLTGRLKREGLAALPYHAGMEDGLRKANQRSFLRDDVSIIVATVAFGMGINKSNVRYVIHYVLPDSLETYYQQVGRAGRDGLRSDCLLLFDRPDIATVRHFIDSGPDTERAGRMARLQAMVRFAEASVCRRKPLLTYFGDPEPGKSCAMCDNCVADESGRTATDVSAEARLVLSCIEQTHQRFGTVHVVDVLRGSLSAKVLKMKHNLLPVHGSGKYRPTDEWRNLVDRLIEAGVVEAGMEHGELRITAEGRRVLAGHPISVILSERRQTGSVAKNQVGDSLLFEELRQLRKRLADDSNVPAFVVFSDRALTEMATARPQTIDQFRRINGVGEHKAETYGETFTAVIREFVNIHSTPESLHKKVGVRARELGELFQSGLSIRQIQDELSIKESTVIQHLMDYARAGNRLDSDRVLRDCNLSEDDRNRALACFSSLGCDRLRPIYDCLNEKVSFDNLHILRLYLICKKMEQSIPI